MAIGSIGAPGQIGTSPRNRPQFNQTRQALELQKQIRNQLGVFTHPNEALPPNTIESLSEQQRESLNAMEDSPQKTILQNQMIDQAQAQSIFTAIGADQRKVQASRGMGIPPHQVQSVAPFGLSEPPERAHSPFPSGMGFQQMSLFLTTMFQMMMSISQLGNGFSSFLGGGQAYPSYSHTPHPDSLVG